MTERPPETRSDAPTPRRPHSSDRLRRIACLALTLLGAGCQTMVNTILPPPPEGQPGHVRGFLGAAVADEPRAALEARETLYEGGNAADAAVALGFTLAVTLPSRASLGGGGACVVWFPERDKTPLALLFLPQAPAAAPAADADRPASVPMLARGLAALHARYGRRPIASLLTPAESLAHYGVPASRLLAQDLAVVAVPLLADPDARALFAAMGGGTLAEGATLLQPDLAATLAQIRINGIDDFYGGALGHHLADASRQAGGTFSASDLTNTKAVFATPLLLSQPPNRVAFLPLPADGGLAAAAAFRVLAHDPKAIAAAQQRAIATAARYRQAGGDAQSLLNSDPPAASLSLLPASTSFVVLDRRGNAVACSLTMNNLFGTGRIAPGTGIMLAASPRAVTPPLLPAAIAWNPNRVAFRAAVAASGQGGAPLAVAFDMLNALGSRDPMLKPVPEPGRANAISCHRYLPGEERTCHWATDPRGSGLALGAPKE